MVHRWLVLVLAAVAALSAAPAASAATLTVDDDRAQCPGAQFAAIQPAIDAAAAGDTVAVCAGTYVEGNGGSGTNALLISNKSLDIRGAGADLVAIQPKRTTATGGRIAETTPAIRNGVGDIVSVIGTRGSPTTVNVSGITVDGNGVFVEAGIVYRDAGGTVSRSRVTNLVTSEADTAETLAGGYRSDFPGIGIAQVTSGAATPAATRPPLNIVQTRISRYNRYGVLIDSATGDTPPLTNAGLTNTATLTGNQIVGRTQCTAFNTPTPPPYVLGGAGATPTNQLPGNCSSVGLTTTGTTFGQDGVRVTSGSTAAITDTTISANLVHGTAAPTYNSATNNANLPLAAGVRFIGAGASTVTASNLTDNAFGVLNVLPDGTSANTTTPVSAENNFWGLRTTATNNLGPAVSPATNPAYQESAVNGAAAVDATCVGSAGTAVPGSNAVDFCPFRNGNQADPGAGQLPVAYAPLPISDGGPSVTLAVDKATYDRGEAATLSATASDDFGVASIVFYDGTAPIATVVPPAGSTTFTIPADAPCAARTLTAVATDSSGQTASSTQTITVVGPNNCQPVDGGGGTTPPGGGTTPPGGGTTTPTPGTAAPTVALTGVPVTLPTRGATVGATVTVAPTLTVATVVFMLGNRVVCTDTAAPYSCDVTPLGRDTGRQALVATVTDSAGQVAAAETRTTVARFAAKASLSVKRIASKRKLVRRISGRLSFSKRVSRKAGCATGTVTMSIEKNGSTLFPLTQIPLKRDCTYALTFKVPKTRRHAFAVELRFGGNDVLLPSRNSRRFK